MKLFNQNKKGNVVASLMKASAAISMCVFFAACGEDSSNNSNVSEQAGCFVSKNDDGESYTLKCLDGTEVVIHDGKDGSDGKAGSDGKDDSAGAGCTIKELDGGAISLTCPDGTSLVFNSDGKVTPVVSSDSKSPKSSSSSKTDKKSSSSMKTDGKSSSSAKADGKSSSSNKTVDKGQGYVQFNADVYHSFKNAGVYLYDSDNMSDTAVVKLTSTVCGDSVMLKLNRYERYFYAPFKMSFDGGKSGVLKVCSGYSISVEYADASTGVSQFDEAFISAAKSDVVDNVSISFGNSSYKDDVDKAVIFLHDESLLDDEPVNVYVQSVATISETICGDGSNGVMGCTVNTKTDTTEKKKKIVLYPVSGGETSDRIGFVEFVVGESDDGQVSVKGDCDLTVTYTSDYFSKDYSTKATWSMSELYGLTCTMDGKIQKGVKDSSKSYVCDAGEIRLVNDGEYKVGKGCTSYNGKDNDSYKNVKIVCSAGEWSLICGKNGELVEDPFDGKTKVCDAGEFRSLNDKEELIGKGCTSYNEKDSVKVDGVAWLCSSGKWKVTNIKYVIGTMKDSRDGKTYKTVTIGSQTWMAENMSYDYEVDGESYGNYCNADDCTTYGRNYTWVVALEACPKGWHLPDTTEWRTLYKAIGNDPYAMQAKGYDRWNDATNVSGISALPAGYEHNFGVYSFGGSAIFWSSTESNGDNAYCWYLGVNEADLNSGCLKSRGLSVRCLKDSE